MGVHQNIAQYPHHQRSAAVANQVDDEQEQGDGGCPRLSARNALANRILGAQIAIMKDGCAQQHSQCEGHAVGGETDPVKRHADDQHNAR